MATPISNINNSIISSEMVLWEGPNIPCIDLCTGEKVSSVIAKIGTELCNIVTDINELQNLDYTCMISKFNYTGALLTPTNFSFKLLFQLLLDNDCTLVQLINDIKATSATSTVNLQGLELKCITNELLNLCGQIPTNLDILKVTQAIINILCEVQDDVADLLIRVITLETQVNSLGNPGTGGYTEPYIGPVPVGAPVGSVGTTGSCLNSGTSLLMSEHIPQITDKEICDLKDLVGTAVQVEDVLNNQCLGDYLTNADIIQNPLNLAQAAKNREIIICDLINRLTLIENSCCSFGCKDIKIGFLQGYDATTNTYTLTFSFGAGTDIPQIFNDCGSTFILTDWKGISTTITNNPLSLSTQLINGSVFYINLSGTGLDTTRNIDIKINTCFTNTQNGLICKDCFGGVLDASANLITNTCWDFAVPLTDVLGVSTKTLYYHSIITSQGTVSLNNTSTSSNTSLSLPTTVISSNVSNIGYCGNAKIKLTIDNQSTTDVPEIKLGIANTNPTLYIHIPGTFNSSCLC